MGNKQFQFNSSDAVDALSQVDEDSTLIDKIIAVLLTTETREISA